MAPTIFLLIFLFVFFALFVCILPDFLYFLAWAIGELIGLLFHIVIAILESIFVMILRCITFMHIVADHTPRKLQGTVLGAFVLGTVVFLAWIFN